LKSDNIKNKKKNTTTNNNNGRSRSGPVPDPKIILVVFGTFLRDESEVVGLGLRVELLTLDDTRAACQKIIHRRKLKQVR